MNNTTQYTLLDPLPSHHTVAVYGLGISGIAAIKLLRHFGKHVVASDVNHHLAKQNAFIHNNDDPKIEVVLGKNVYKNATIIVVSPGIKPSTPALQEAQKDGIPIISELELGYLACPIKIIAVTGTDGKTTTTKLCEHTLNACNIPCVSAGNTGYALCQCLLDLDKTKQACQYIIVETSAFQLVFCHEFKAKIVITTNIAQDHKDYFDGNQLAYIRAKYTCLKNSKEEDIVILNYEDAIITSWRKKTEARCIGYGLNRAKVRSIDQSQYICLQDNVLNANVTQTHVIKKAQAVMDMIQDASSNLLGIRADTMMNIKDELNHLPGKHNLMNFLAVAATARCLGCSYDEILAAVSNFTLPPHRMQVVGCSSDGITFINDSKATNPHAASACLDSLEDTAILIAGGVDKELEINFWIDEIIQHCPAVVLIGELATRLGTACQKYNLDISFAKDLSQSLDIAVQKAIQYKAKFVLFSPGGSSYDMFTDFHERGNAFMQACQKYIDA